MSTPTKPDERRFFHKRHVLHIFGFSESTLWQKCKDGTFPRPYHLGRLAVWTNKQLDDVILKITEGDE